MQFIKELLTNKNNDRSLHLGKIRNRFFQKEILTESELNHHVHIVGASGYGKTVLISQMIEQQNIQGKGLIFIDLKGDIETLNKFTDFVHNNNRQDDLLIFSLADQSISRNYNLISDGTATQLRDKIMRSFDWSEEFYKNQAGSNLLKLLLGLVYLRDYQNLNFDLSTILKATESTEYLQDLMAQIPAIEKDSLFAMQSCLGFLDRARSSKMSVVVAHQEICDLERISPEFAGRLMGNISTLYAFLQKRPESADMISGMAGTQTVWKHTKQTERWGFFEIDSGKGTKREAEEFVIHPNVIKSLGVGKCVCIKKYPYARAYLVDVNAN